MQQCHKFTTSCCSSKLQHPPPYNFPGHNGPSLPWSLYSESRCIQPPYNCLCTVRLIICTFVLTTRSLHLQVLGLHNQQLRGQSRKEAKLFFKDLGMACHALPLKKVKKQGEMPLPSLSPIPFKKCRI